MNRLSAIQSRLITGQDRRVGEAGRGGVLGREARRGDRPADVYGGIVPENAAFGLRRIEIGALVKHLGPVGERAEAVGGLPPEELEAARQKVLQRVKDLLDEWCRVADLKRKAGATLQYQAHEVTGPHLLYDPLDAELQTLPAGPRKFRAHRSLRDVEPSVPLWLKRLDGMEIPAEEAE